jgi:hypothetical protein
MLGNGLARAVNPEWWKQASQRPRESLRFEKQNTRVLKAKHSGKKQNYSDLNN